MTKLIETINQIVKNAREAKMSDDNFANHIVSQADPTIHYLYWELWEKARIDMTTGVEKVAQDSVEGR